MFSLSQLVAIWNVIDRPAQNPHLLFPSIYSPLVAHQRLLWRRFSGRTPKTCTTNLGIWYFFGAETYIHFMAQETRIIRILFVFILFLSSQKVKINNVVFHESWYNQSYIFLIIEHWLPISTFFNEKIKKKIICW